MPIDLDQLLALGAPLGGLLPRSQGFYAGLMLLGFFVALWGRGMHSNVVQVLGIIIIFASVLALPVALKLFG